MEELVRRSTGRLYPLVPEGLRAAAACLKWGGYKSPTGYLSGLKQGHTQSEGSPPWRLTPCSSR